MSDRSPRQSQGGEYDYTRYNKGSPDSKGGFQKRSNMSPGEKITNYSSNSYHEHHGRHSNSYPQNRRQERERDADHHTSYSGRNPTGSNHRLPFHKGFGSSDTSGFASRPVYSNQTDNRGQRHLKDEFENNGLQRKPGQLDRSNEIGSRSGYNYSNISPKSAYNITESENLSNKSSESSRLNFPAGHPNHNPHLPPPNPFSSHPKSSLSSLSSSHPPIPKSSSEKYRNHTREADKEVNADYRDGNRSHERLSTSTSLKPSPPSFYGNFYLILKSHISFQNIMMMLSNS